MDIYYNMHLHDNNNNYVLTGLITYAMLQCANFEDLSIFSFGTFFLSCSLHSCIRAGFTAVSIDTAPTTVLQLLLH